MLSGLSRVTTWRAVGQRQVHRGEDSTYVIPRSSAPDVAADSITQALGWRERACGGGSERRGKSEPGAGVRPRAGGQHSRGVRAASKARVRLRAAGRRVCSLAIPEAGHVQEQRRTPSGPRWRKKEGRERLRPAEAPQCTPKTWVEACAQRSSARFESTQLLSRAKNLRASATTKRRQPDAREERPPRAVVVRGGAQSKHAHTGHTTTRNTHTHTHTHTPYRASSRSGTSTAHTWGRARNTTCCPKTRERGTHTPDSALSPTAERNLRAYRLPSTTTTQRHRPHATRLGTRNVKKLSHLCQRERGR